MTEVTQTALDTRSSADRASGPNVSSGPPRAGAFKFNLPWARGPFKLAATY
jgi:hypothetical protein